MTDESALSQAAAKAARAQNLLENELLQEAYSLREADLVAAWIATRPDDKDGRESCWTAIHANRKHHDYLVSFVTNGKLAARELKDLADTAERQKRFGTIQP